MQPDLFGAVLFAIAAGFVGGYLYWARRRDNQRRAAVNAERRHARLRAYAAMSAPTLSPIGSEGAMAVVPSAASAGGALERGQVGSRSRPGRHGPIRVSRFDGSPLIPIERRPRALTAGGEGHPPPDPPPTRPPSPPDRRRDGGTPMKKPSRPAPGRRRGDDPKGAILACLREGPHTLAQLEWKLRADVGGLNQHLAALLTAPPERRYASISLYTPGNPTFTLVQPDCRALPAGEVVSIA